MDEWKQKICRWDEMKWLNYIIVTITYHDGEEDGNWFDFLKKYFYLFICTYNYNAYITATTITIISIW